MAARGLLQQHRAHDRFLQRQGIPGRLLHNRQPQQGLNHGDLSIGIAPTRLNLQQLHHSQPIPWTLCYSMEMKHLQT
jgi:hypothetical protein